MNVTNLLTVLYLRQSCMSSFFSLAFTVLIPQIFFLT